MEDRLKQMDEQFTNANGFSSVYSALCTTIQTNEFEYKSRAFVCVSNEKRNFNKMTQFWIPFRHGAIQQKCLEEDYSKNSLTDFAYKSYLLNGKMLWMCKN